MKIRRVRITGFRGFQKLVVNFPEDADVIVFIGINGAGKSAVLDAISLLLSALVKNICSKANTKISGSLNKDDINSQSDGYEIQMEFDSKSHRDLSIVNEHSRKSYTISLTESIHSKRVLDGKYDEFIHTTRLSSNIPVFIHYQTNRNYIERSNSEPKYVRGYENPQFFAYKNAFSDNINLFNDFVKWFREEEDLENQNQREQQNFHHRNELLEVVRSSIDKFLNEFDRSARFSNLRIERERTSDRITLSQEPITSSLIINKDGKKFKFSQLSSGEKMIMSLVVDIARRLAIANPDRHDKLTGEGVVLIDEIDLHLHPQWQRRLLPALMHTFPNLQFIVTTHSPQVLSHISKNSVFLLEDNKISERDIYTEGRDSNSILQDAFHVPIIEREYEQQLNEIYYLIDRHDVENAQVKLEKLKEKRGEDDREVLRMQSFIDMDNIL
jgi:predicted ATP-binding protein involved in virulence